MSHPRFKKNIYFVAIGQVSQKLLAFALIPFAARSLGDAGFGQFSLATAIMYVVVLINDWGTSTFLTREISRHNEKLSFYFWNTLSIKLLFVFLDYLVLLLFLQWTHYAIQTQYAILVFAAYGITSSVMQLCIGVYQAFERMIFEAIVLTLEKVLITGVGIFVLQKGLGLLPFCAVFVFGGLVSALIAVLLVQLYFPLRRFPVSIDGAMDIFKHSLPFGISLIFATIYNYTGIFVLSLMRTPQEVGWFSASFKLINITNIIPFILCGAMYPRFSRDLAARHASQPGMLYTQGFKYLYFLALPMIAGVLLLADKLIPIIFGEQFMPGISSLRIMVWTAAFVFFNLYFTSLLKAANLQKWMVRIQGIALGINVILNVILISLISFHGAAITTVLTELFIFTSYFIMIHKQIYRIARSNFWFKGIVSTLVMSFFIHMCRSISLFPLIFISAAVYFSVLYIFRGFSFSEIMPLTRNRGDFNT